MPNYEYQIILKDPTSNGSLLLPEQDKQSLIKMRQEWSVEQGYQTEEAWMRREVEDELAWSCVGIIFAREENGGDVGFGTLEQEPGKDVHTLQYGSAFVREPYRRQGVFKEITRNVAKAAKSLGGEVLYAYPSTNGVHIPSMKRMGFKVVDTSAYNDLTLQKKL